MAFELFFILLEAFGEFLFWFIPEKSKLQRNIDRLKKERWFSRLYGNDFDALMERDPKLKKFLKKRRNVRLLLKNEYEREHFIRDIESSIHVPGTKTEPLRRNGF